MTATDEMERGGTGRSLVVLDPIRVDAPRMVSPSVIPNPAFLSQLFALSDGMPCQRARRRADPHDGATAYHDTELLDRRLPRARLLRRA